MSREISIATGGRYGLYALGAAIIAFHTGDLLATTGTVNRQEESVPLHRVQRNERLPGSIFIAVPVAHVFGTGGDRSPLYCSPSVSATNSSSKAIAELIVGIDFQSKAGQSAGASMARFTDIRVGQETVHSFYRLPGGNCVGLEGQMEVIRCAYVSGEDCSKDVKPLSQGAIPLRIKVR